MWKLAFNRIVTLTVLGLLLAGGLTMGYRSVANKVAADVYRQRLVQMAEQYEELRDTYNDVVRRTAVTELIVHDGQLSVAVRTAEGIEREIPTSLDPSGEIYVDFVIIDGRLWIRRVFDSATPPVNGQVIDPSLVSVDWSDDARVGKAVYRSLDEGRWLVTVTGNGSLGLERAESEYTPLSPPPHVSSPEELKDADSRVSGIGAGDVWSWLVTGDQGK